MVETLSPTRAHPRVLTQPGTRSTWQIVSQGVQRGFGKPGIQNSSGAWGVLILNCSKPAWRCPVPSPDQEFVSIPYIALSAGVQMFTPGHSVTCTPPVYHWGFPKSKLGIFPSPPAGSVPLLTEMFYHLLPLLLPLTATVVRSFQKETVVRKERKFDIHLSCFWRLWNSSGNLDV